MSIEALPRHRAMLTLPKRCLVVILSPSAPERRPIDLLISRMVEMKSSAKPPRVSATRGMHVKPIERQLVQLEEASLRWTPTWRAWPWVRVVLDIVRDWRGEITWTSRVAGRPLVQLGSRTSAGREAESGTSPNRLVHCELCNEAFGNSWRVHTNLP